VRVGSVVKAEAVAGYAAAIETAGRTLAKRRRMGAPLFGLLKVVA
jgi:hypothetical protein